MAVGLFARAHQGIPALGQRYLVGEGHLQVGLGDVSDEEEAEEGGDDSEGRDDEEVGGGVEEAESEGGDESCRHVGEAVEGAEYSKHLALPLQLPVFFAGQVDVPALTDPQKPCGTPSQARTRAGYQVLQHG